MARSKGNKRHSEEKLTRPRPLIPFATALSGGLLLWAAFPPIGLSWLGWLAPLPWIWLVRERERTGRWFWLQLWLAGTVSWILLLEGIRRAHPANNLGLLALALYLGAYCPAFIAVVRVAVLRVNVPLAAAASVVWTALELVRGYLFTGFSMGLLAHTQSEQTVLIQIAELFGAYGVSFLMVLVAASLLPLVPRAGETRRRAPAVIAIGMVVVVCMYGAVRMRTQPGAEQESQLKVALLQGTRDKIFEFNRELNRRTWEQYSELMLRAKTERPDVDLIVWPEATFTSEGPETFIEGSLIPPPETEISSELYTEMGKRQSLHFLERARMAAEAVNAKRSTDESSHETFQIIGAETLVFAGDSVRNYNSALLLDPHGAILERYYKCHAVMFGEYIPFGGVWPWLYSLTPMRQGLSCGDGPRIFEVKGFRIAPNICFEITVPHLLRRGHRTLVQQGTAAPDVLVNVSDDGWFWGSTVLDLQLACAVFRAVELRRPVLIAANTGISASLDGNGRIVERSPKRQEDIIYATVVRDGRSSLYCWWGDAPALLCLALSIVWIVQSRFQRRLSLRDSP